MSTTCFITYEIHPTTRDGCGVLLHHAAELLLRDGHEVVFLLAVPRHEFEQFASKDRLLFPNAERCRAYHLDELCQDFGIRPEECPSRPVWESARFAHAYGKLAAIERLDFVEFFEYCGVSHHSLTRRLFGRERAGADGRLPVLGSRLHNSLEIIDRLGSTRWLDRARYHLYGLERGGLRFSEAVLTPTWTYFESYYRDDYAIAPTKAVLSQSPKLDMTRVARRPDPATGRPFTIAYVGRMFQFKGVDQLVHAGVELLRRRPSLACTFDIIGPDAVESPLGESFVEYLRSMIPGALRERFVFPGHVPHEKIAERLGDALFAVFPNKFESFCYAAHEVYDAGVPVIVNDIPGFRDFFHHERNALVYDGRTDSLVGAMERMLDDHALRESLYKPYAIADKPLGDFYARPKALDPLVPAGVPSGAPAVRTQFPRVLTIILSDSVTGGMSVFGGTGVSPVSSHSTTGEMEVVGWMGGTGTGGTPVPPISPVSSSTLILLAAAPDAEETFWFLGRPWHARDPHGRPVSPAQIVTLDALAILRAGDRPGPQWLQACATALANRDSLGYAATWARRSDRLVTSTIDITPEIIPFEHGAAPLRALMRTTPGRLLLDVFDPVLGPLGEIGYLWRCWTEFGPGAVLAEPLIELADDPPASVEPNLLKYLLMRYGGAFADRLAIYAGLMHERVEGISAQLRSVAAAAAVPLPEPRELSPEPALEHKIQMAEQLGGKLLARMAFRKFTRKIAGKTPRA